MRAESRVARRGRAVGTARLRYPAAEHGGVVGLGNDDLGCRAGLLQHTRHAVERAARAESRDPVVEPLAREVGEDLLRRGARMNISIRFVLELPAQIPT